MLGHGSRVRRWQCTNETVCEGLLACIILSNRGKYTGIYQKIIELLIR